MNLNIRKEIMEKMKNDNEKEIVSTLNESVITDDELILPGLGVMLELFWNDLDEKDKFNIANIIKNNIKKEKDLIK